MRNLKRFFIFVGIFILIIIPIIIAVLANSQGNTHKEADSAISPTPGLNSLQGSNSNASLNNTITKKKIIEDTKINTEIAEGNTQTWVLEEHPFYTLSYLSGWTNDLSNNPGGGSTLIFKPKSLNAHETIPSLEIEETKVDPSKPLSDIILSYTKTGLTQHPATFHGIEATVLNGLIQDENNIPNQIKIHRTFIFLTKTYRDYVISFSYYKDTNEQKYLQIYDVMLNSFIFKL